MDSQKQGDKNDTIIDKKTLITKIDNRVKTKVLKFI